MSQSCVSAQADASAESLAYSPLSRFSRSTISANSFWSFNFALATPLGYATRNGGRSYMIAGTPAAIASHAAITFQTIGMGAKSSEAAEKEQEQFKSKTYKDALDKLNKEQVSLSPKLKWSK